MRNLVWAVAGMVVLAGVLNPAFGQTITSVTVADKAGVTTANYPLTVSLIFRPGDVASHVTAKVAGQDLATQTDVKIRWPDGSVKHALVSFLLPVIHANSAVLVEIVSGGANANAGGMTREDLLAGDFDARMTITVAGSPSTVTARDLLAGIANPEYWIRGSVCTEMLIRDFAANIANQLNVQYYIRRYPGWNGYRVDTVVENCRTQNIGNLTYDFDLALGHASSASVFARTNFTHTFNARWHKVFWLGTEPPAVEVRHNLPYMIATGIVPRYDTGLLVPEATIASAYGSWLNSGRDIMDNGIIMTGMPTTGGRQDIGLYPTWTARYLLGMDRRLAEIMLSCGDLSGSIPIHLRESDPARSFHRHVMSINDRRTVWASQPTYIYTKAEDKMTVVGATSSEWQVDKAHQPSLAAIPYLVTGEFYYLEELYFWAAWNLSDSNYGYRQYEKGILRDQVRGEAWAIRTIADAANLAPDAHALEKSYFAEKVDNNIAFYTATYVEAPASKYPSVHYWGKASNMAHDSGRVDASLDATCRYYISPWMEDFVLLSMAHLKDMGFATDGIIGWLGETLINRFHHPDYNWNRGAPYHLPVQYNDGANGGIPYATWADVNSAYADDVGPSDLPNPDYPFSYTYIARAAMAHVLHLADGSAAWTWLDSHIHTKSKLNEDPTWAFVPTIAWPDATSPAAVANLAAGSFTGSSCVLTWTAPGDDGATGRPAVYDIRHATEPITEDNWASAVQITGEPAAAPAGTNQSMAVTGLPSATMLYFAMKTSDEAPNLSGLSNVAAGITGPAVPPTIRFAAAAGSDLETNPAPSVVVALEFASTLPVTVEYAVTGGTATGGGIDYAISGTSLRFEPGETVKTIPLTVRNDSLVEADETITIALASPFNATLVEAATHTYTILDDEAATLPVVQFQTASSRTDESAGTPNLVVTLDKPFDRVVTVDYAVSSDAAAEGADYSLPAPEAFVAALKRDAGLAAGGALDPLFAGLTTSDVVTANVNDAMLFNSGNARYYNYGWSATADYYALAGFDLSACAGATVRKAQLRIRCSAGNSTVSWAGIKSHDWVEGNKTGSYAGGGNASPGVSVAHPAGLHTAASGALGWGGNSDSFLNFTGDGPDLYAWTAFASAPSGAAWCVADVTAQVQAWCSGQKPNYGLLVNLGNHRAYLSDKGSTEQPVLFLDCTRTTRSITFAPGETSKVIPLEVLDDSAAELAETLRITLSPPMNGLLGANAAHDYTILDDDGILGDIDGDGHVNVFDIFVIAESWNTRAGDQLYNPAADLDADGSINVFDIFIVAENWGRQEQ